MKKQTLTILALAGVAWWILKKNHRASGSDVLDNAEEPLIAPSRDRVGMMTDAPVSLENIRKGIARGWYKAQLCTIDGKPAVKLTGTANGKLYSDYYPISEEDYKTLQNEGVQPIGRCGVGSNMRSDAEALDKAARAMERYSKYLWNKYGGRWYYDMLDKEDKIAFDELNADWVDARRNYYRWHGYNSIPR